MTEKTKKKENVTQGFDLTAFDTRSVSEEGTVMTPTDKVSGKELPIRLLVVGEDSTKYAEVMDKVRARQIKLREKRRQFDGEMNYSDMREQAPFIASHLCIDWWTVDENGEKVCSYIAFEGKDLTCNNVTRNKVFQALKWLANDVVGYSRDPGNFTNA